MYRLTKSLHRGACEVHQDKPDKRLGNTLFAIACGIIIPASLKLSTRKTIRQGTEFSTYRIKLGLPYDLSLVLFFIQVVS